MTKSKYEIDDYELVKGLIDRLNFYREQCNNYGWTLNRLIDILNIKVPEGKFGIDIRVKIIEKVRELSENNNCR